jgi:hypothetical protein
MEEYEFIDLIYGKSSDILDQLQEYSQLPRGECQYMDFMGVVFSDEDVKKLSSIVKSWTSTALVINFTNCSLLVETIQTFRDIGRHVSIITDISPCSKDYCIHLYMKSKSIYRDLLPSVNQELRIDLYNAFVKKEAAYLNLVSGYFLDGNYLIAINVARAKLLATLAVERGSSSGRKILDEIDKNPYESEIE